MQKTKARRKRTSAGRKAKPGRKYVFPVVIEKDEGGYFAICPTLQGCYTQGDTYEEALGNMEDALRLHVEDRLENGESVPNSDLVSLTTLEVRV